MRGLLIMSRIGKKPITIPAGVQVNITPGEIKVAGPKGEMFEKLHPHVKIEQKEGVIEVSVKNPEEKRDRALWGLFRSLAANMIIGVTEGFAKKLEVNGIGFRVALQGKKLVLNIGFSHPVEFKLPSGVTAQVDKNVITIAGISKQLVGETAARIRALRRPEPYKGKGIKYLDEQIRRKAGKVVKGTETK